MGISRLEVMERLAATIAADHGCSASNLLEGKVMVCERVSSRLRNPDRRRFAAPTPDFGAATFGNGGAVSATRELYDEVQTLFAGSVRDGLMWAHRLGRIAGILPRYGLRLYGPLLRFSVSSEDLRTIPAPKGISISVFDRPPVRDLDPYPWPNTLRRWQGEENPLLLSAHAMRGAELVGLATAADQTDHICEIGVDVLPTAQGGGLGKALTAKLAAAIIDCGRVPYYGTSMSNLPSMRTALATGFFPAWTEVITRVEDVKSFPVNRIRHHRIP